MAAVDAKVKIENKLGLHARPAMSFVDVASKFSASISVTKDSQTVDGKSIMQLMMLAATHGSTLSIHAEGPDAEQAIAALVDLIQNGINEE